MSIQRPLPQDGTAPADLRRAAVHETIEPLALPLLLLEGSRIVEANRAARAVLGDHVAGEDARVALRHPEAIRLIGMGDGESVAIPGFTGARTFWQLTRRNIGDDRWMIELDDRTAEADVSKAHTDFVANASHELRTPLAAIIGYAETLGDPDAPTDTATTLRFNQIIQREAQRMLTLVQDLMTLSHVEAEKHDPPTERLDLGALATRVVGEVSSLKGKERVELAAAEGGLTVLGDAGQLEQMLRNLIDNALKYGGAETPVSVAAIHRDGRALLTVRDRGPGIAPEHLPHLTRRFYRTDPGRSRASGGTGLGLAIVKHMVERHQGALDIASTLGEGTTVSVALPLAP
ncbi:MAG: ATP-binding protein [Sphingomonadaceae bacterium]